MTAKRIAILTSGGDCPGLNAVLRGTVRAANLLRWEVIGIQEGFEGLLDGGKHIRLDLTNTAGIMHLGGTILGATNKGRFISKRSGGKKATIHPDILDNASRTLSGLDVAALVVVGGDGSLATALQMHRAGFPLVGIPKTIDNDLAATELTFGFDSAVGCVADALGRLHPTAASHRRIMVLEVMGRHAGWIALHGGLSGGGDIILIPEIPFDYARITEAIQKRETEGATSHMIVVAEGAAPIDGRPTFQSMGGGDYRLGGIGDRVAREVGRRVGREARSCALGHLQRGGHPTPLDRILGTRFGVKAVELIEQGRLGTMVSYCCGQIGHVPIADAVHHMRKISSADQMVLTARSVGISFGD